MNTPSGSAYKPSASVLSSGASSQVGGAAHQEQLQNVGLERHDAGGIQALNADSLRAHVLATSALSLKQILIMVLLLTLMAALPWLAEQIGWDYYIGFMRRVMIMMTVAISLNFILGYAGMVALGHAGFMGVGAYALVIALDAGQSNVWLMLLYALLASAFFALLIGAISIRTKDAYFIMITLAFAQMLYYITMSLGFLGGEDGYAIYVPFSFGAWLDEFEHTFYYLVLAILCLVFLLNERVLKSRFGIALKGTRENSTRMLALGYPVYAIHLCAFVIAGAVAGLGGALLAINDNYVSPQMMSFSESAALVIMIILGGMATRWGPIIGVAVWLGLSEVLKLYTDFWHWPMGLLLIVLVFFSPQGIVGLFKKRTS
ncbi:MAG: branched-chain amino acid ABC transporter permease [Pelistega sp.]|nr:branched-chain amino acid ABC transporter permease [Pelistega sp.]